MVHNGIEYGDMQLIAEAYDVLRVVGGLTVPELAQVFTDWNKVGLDLSGGGVRCCASLYPGCRGILWKLRVFASMPSFFSSHPISC